MAITYHAGRRIQGTQADFDGIPAISGGWKELGRTTLLSSPSGSATFSDDFTGADNWSKSPSDSQFKVNTTTDRLEFLENASAGGDRCWYDLGTGVSETKWVLRFKLRFTTIANQSDYPEIDIGISDNHANSDTNQDFIGCRILPMSANNIFRPRKCIAEKPRRGAVASHNPSPAFTTGKDYFIEFQRKSATDWSASLSNTNAFDGDIYSGSFTNASTSLNALRYITVMDGTTATSGDMEGYIKDVEFWNNQSYGAEDKISVSSLDDKRYYMVLGDYRSSSAINVNGRLGNSSIDPNTNYRERQQTNGTGYSPLTTQSSAPQFGTLSGNAGFGVEYIANKSDKEKLGITNAVKQNTAGAGDTPERFQSAWKWSDKNNELDAIERRTSVNTYDGGSEVVVLGWDPDDTHTDNFWEELASENGTGATSFNSGTFTAKKYLWVQIYVDRSADASNGEITVGNTTLDSSGTDGNDGKYSRRRSADGGSDDELDNQTKISLRTAGLKEFYNIFIINNSGNNKLLIIDQNAGGAAGADHSPYRGEFVAKWANTSNQINIIGFGSGGSNTLSSTSIIKVWGSN
jgi:hypothetical protein